MLTIGSKGRFTVNPPFVLPAVEYEVIAAQSISAMLEVGLNPYDLVYSPYGLDEAFYRGIPKGELIYLLRSSSDLRYVPVNAIVHVDEVSYIAYTDQALVLQIGAHPTGTQFPTFLTALKTLTQEALGVDPIIQIRDISKSTPIERDEHLALQTERGLVKTKAIPTTTTNGVEYENKTLRVKITALEQFIARYASECLSGDCLCEAKTINYGEDVVFYQYSLADYVLQANRGDQHDLPLNNAFVQRLHYFNTPKPYMSLVN